MTPEISVVIPAWNAERYLQQALNSVILQEYQCWEVIVVDDGSEDGTAELVKSNQWSRGRILYQFQEHHGRAAARNAGIAVARGKWVAFLDADDWWHHNKLAEQTCGGRGLRYTQVRYVREDGSRIRHRRHWLPDGERLQYGNFIPMSSVMVERLALERAGGFSTDPALAGAEDWELWLRLAEKVRLCPIQEELTFYRCHHDTLSHQTILRAALRVIDGMDNSVQRRARANLYMGMAVYPSPAVSLKERLTWALTGARCFVGMR